MRCAPGERDGVAVRRGFTLLEVLAALTILVMVAAVAGTITVQTLYYKRKLEHESLAPQIVDVLFNMIRRDLHRLFVHGISDPFAGVDNGDADSLDFVCTTPSMPDAETRLRHHLTEVGYRAVQNEDDPNFYLLLRRESPGVSGSPLKGGTLRVLFDRILAFNLQYYDGQEWFDSWSYKDTKGQLPAAVKVTITFPEEMNPDPKAGEPVTYQTTIYIPLAEDHPPKPQE